MRLAKSFTVCLLWAISVAAYGQKGCQEKLSVTSVRDINGEGTRVEFEVVSKGSFRGKVVSSSTTTGEVIAKEFSGSGSERITVNKLDRNLVYTVIIEFDGEKNFLCKTKALPDIFSTDKQ